MASPMPPAQMGGMPGQNVVPFPGPSPMGMPPPMMPNPAYQQWQQQAQAWQQEKMKRQQMFLSSCDYIKSDARKRYNIDIEADSTIAPDQEAEKAARTQFLQAVTPFMESIIPLAVQMPPMKPLIKEMIMFAVRGFTVSRQLEDAFETALDQLMQMPPSPPQQQPQHGKSPQEIQSEQQIAQGEQHTDLQVQQMRSASDASKEQTDQQANSIKLMQLYQQQNAEQARLQQEGANQSAELSLKNREMVGRELLEHARISRIESQNTKGLV